jgi:hypothetical protein
MAYIGNTVENQGFTPAIDYFNGDGVTVTFTLSRPVASVAQVIVAIDNVIQNPNSAFTVAGNAITFSSAPLSGTNNIWVEYTSLITSYAAISQDPTVIGDIRATGGYLAEGDFGNSFVDGAILDYVTGNGRITVGDLDGLTIYNGGTAARTALTTFTAAGNVGIGTASPTQKLDVSGNSAITGTGYLSLQRPVIPVVNQGTPQIAFQYYTTGTTYTTGALITASADGSWSASSAPTNLLFYTAPSGSTSVSERMRITSDGNLAIGRNNAASVRLIVQSLGNSNTTYSFITQNLASNNTFYVRDDGLINTGGVSASPYNLTTASAANLFVQSDGSLLRSTSSLKYKTDVENATHGLAEVLTLRPVIYKGKTDGDKVYGGLIAEEVDAAGLTEFVVYRDDDGTPDALNYGNMVALAFKAIQELNAKVTALEAKLEAK